MFALTCSIGGIYTSSLQLELSKTNRIGDTKYTNWCTEVSKNMKSLLQIPNSIKKILKRKKERKKRRN